MFCQKCGTQNPDHGKFCRACGTDLGNAAAVASAGAAFQPPQNLNHSALPANTYIDRKGRMRSNNPDDLWSGGIRNTISGIGFLIIAMALLITKVAGGDAWWWAMLFPAFSLLSSGLGNIAKAKRLEKKQSQSAELQTQSPMLFADRQTRTGANLPPAQTDYVESPRKSIYDTGDFEAPPSVVEGTTRHLEMNAEGETMTLPKDRN